MNNYITNYVIYWDLRRVEESSSRLSQVHPDPVEDGPIVKSSPMIENGEMVSGTESRSLSDIQEEQSSQMRSSSLEISIGRADPE